MASIEQRALTPLSVKNRPLANQFVGQPPLEQLGGKVISMRPAQGANRYEILIGHGLHRGRDIPPALLAADHVIPGSFFGSVKHHQIIGE